MPWYYISLLHRPVKIGCGRDLRCFWRPNIVPANNRRLISYIPHVAGNIAEDTSGGIDTIPEYDGIITTDDDGRIIAQKGIAKNFTRAAKRGRSPPLKTDVPMTRETPKEK